MKTDYKSKAYYAELYPEASDMVHEVLAMGDRKEKYLIVDLKSEKFEVDVKKQTTCFKPSREISLDFLLDNGMDFPASDNVEAEVIRRYEHRSLHEAIDELSKRQQNLVHDIYFEDATETEYGECLSKSQQTVNGRKNVILDDLWVILKKNKNF